MSGFHPNTRRDFLFPPSIVNRNELVSSSSWKGSCWANGFTKNNACAYSAVSLICTSTNCELCRTGSLSADLLQAELLASIKKAQTQTQNLLTGLYAISPSLGLFVGEWRQYVGCEWVSESLHFQGQPSHIKDWLHNCGNFDKLFLELISLTKFY